MNKICMLGTGMGVVTKCFNTCFTIYNGEEHFLVDTGGGSGILAQLEKMDIDIQNIHNVFISHKHTDHIFGIFWLIRKIGKLILDGEYKGNLNIYCHEEVKDVITKIAELTIHSKILKCMNNGIRIITVEDREKLNICGYDVQFVDIGSKKDLQYGFVLTFENKRLVFLGDEPYQGGFDELILNPDWLLTEAFCMYSQRDIFKPYEKWHATVKEACETANRLNAKNLLIYHSEDRNIEKRKELYTAEGKQYFNGNIYVPDDLDIIELK